MNSVQNRKAICDVLMERAKSDKDIIVLCSDSRGSASLAPFAEAYPEQFVEVGIAEQDLVGIAAGLAKCGKKPFAASPACFITTRSYEQAKVDVAYSDTNVTLVGISGGISYGALGMSHHSAQDIAAMAAVPNMRVYLPSDRFQTICLTKALLQDEKPAYVRVGRNAVEDIYEENNCPFAFNQAVAHIPGGSGEWTASVTGQTEFPETDVLLAACGEMVQPCLAAAKLLEQQNVHVVVLDMYCVKPLDQAGLLAAAAKAKAVLTVEEHAPFGGLGSMVSQLVGANCPKKVVNLTLPDAPVITGNSQEVFNHYGLNAEGIAARAKELL